MHGIDSFPPRQFVLDLNEELVVDNFAGGGGASTGIFMALGRHVDLAFNHDPQACAMHAANHPQTRHFCEDVFKVDPREVTQGRRVGLAWFSPDCKHFSKAKGGKPRSKKIRGLAWVMVKWAALVRPRVMVLENVEEFRSWGPLLSNGTLCPERKGKTFGSFVARLRNLGYEVEWRDLRACDYGAPTIRKRLFLIARCDGRPIVWPEPTHFDPRLELARKRMRGERMRPLWRTAGECIDWTLPCRSIFERKRLLAEATMRRIARGIRKFVIDAGEPFIVKYHAAKRAGDDRVGSIAEPLPTQSTENRFALTVPTLIQTGYGERSGQSPRVPGLEKPLGTAVSGQKHALVSACLTEHANASGQRNFSLSEPLRTQCGEVKGGHFALVSAFLAKHYGGHETPGAVLKRPFDTVTSIDHHALISSHISKLYGTNTGQDLRGPAHTVTSGGNHLAEVRAFLVKYYGQGGQDQSCSEPMHTIPTKHRMGLVTVEGEDYVISDIGMRMLEPRELYAAQGFPAGYIIAPEVNGKRLSKSAQVRMCGNSVCPPVAAAIVKANVPELAALEVAAA
jgi:DNA (cytosine-5)-methyltransferase 1